MPVQHAIWKVGDAPAPLQTSRLPSEKLLEDMIVRDPRILSSEWMLIGRQERTSQGGFIDLLAITPDGSLVLIELKRDKTPREVVAQALDYASWVEGLGAEKISQIFSRFTDGKSLDDAFEAHFGGALDEDDLMGLVERVLVAAELDASTERIINYLNARDIAINVIFFQVFQNGGEQFLSRAWLIDPIQTQANVTATTKTKDKGKKEPWNGEYYVSFGRPDHRPWDEARKYGYISAGGGSWYSQTLQRLSPNDRVWVNVPPHGYVGVGRVVESVVPIDEFSVKTDQGERPAKEVLSRADRYKTQAEDPEKAEYFVRVEWLDSVPLEDAVSEVGLFGNTNTVCAPQTPKWRHTIDRLKAQFTKWDRRSAVDRSGDSAASEV